MWSHGTFFWNELNTHDVEAAKGFYARLCGWTFDGMPMESGTYWVAKAGDRMAGGLFQMSGPYFENIPDHWLAYVAVNDTDAAAAEATEAGGMVLRAPWDVPGVGRIAILKDATGAVIGIMTPAPMPGA